MDCKPILNLELLEPNLLHAFFFLTIFWPIYNVLIYIEINIFQLLISNITRDILVALLVGKATTKRFLILLHGFTKQDGYLLIVIVFTVLDNHNISLVWWLGNPISVMLSKKKSKPKYIIIYSTLWISSIVYIGNLAFFLVV